MKLIKSEYKIECQKCHKMYNQFVIKNNELICLNCLNFGRKSRPTKLTAQQKASIKRNLEEYYKKAPKTKIIYGGCFN